MQKDGHLSLFLCVSGIDLCPCSIVTASETKEL